MTYSARPQDEKVVADMFDQIANKYDFLNRLLSMRQDQRWRSDLVKNIPVRPKGFLLDVATGTGDVILKAIQKRPEYTTFHGSDISENMLKLARIKSQNLNITYSQASAEALDVADHNVDCLTISFGLRNVVNKEKALQEFSRVLKSNGVLIILEFFQPENKILGYLYQFYFDHILPKIGGLFSSSSAYKYLPQSVASFYSFAQLKDLLAKNKMPVVKSKNYLFGGCKLIVCENR